MTRLLLVTASLLVASVAAAVPLVPFSGSADFARRATEVVIADCLDPDPDPGPKFGVTTVAVDVVKVLKGDRKLGKATLATIGQPVEKGRRYMMVSFGGSALGTNFLAQSELALVEVPAGFDLKALDDKTVAEQMQLVFDARREQVRVRLIQLGQEKAALDKTVADKAAAPAKLLPPEVKFAGVTTSYGSRVLAFDVVNPNAEPVPYAGYTADSFTPKIPAGTIRPLHKCELRTGGAWKEERIGWCGTGVGPVAVAGKQTVRFEVPVPAVGEWTDVRVGLVWYAGGDGKAAQTAWSAPVSQADATRAAARVIPNRVER
ncbi:hypothetical protein J0H58_10180 [bacterium]|nr:hypothetical protein [bacterium]